MTKEDVLKLFRDFSGGPIKDRSDEININDYVNALDEKNTFPVIYGVNVRMNSKSGIVPFVFTQNAPDFDKDAVTESLSPELTIPAFCSIFKLKSAKFICYVSKETDEIVVSRIESVSYYGERYTEITRSSIQKFVNKVDDKGKLSFLRANINGLKIQSAARICVWIAAEDFDVNSIETSYLSNIMAISTNARVIEKIVWSYERILDFLLVLKNRYAAELEDLRLKAAEQSAKAAIMSRNMSHNLGSHVMAYLKQHLNSVQDMIRDNVLSQIIMPDEIKLKDLEGWRKRIEDTIEKNLRDLEEQKRKSGINEVVPDSREQVKEVALPFLVGLGKFISYLQERQDFIATIATSYAPYFSQVNFKDFIFDELNPDLRYERHSDRIGMKPDNILLGNIARSEGLARVTQPTQSKQEGMSDIIIRFRTFDGHIPSGEQVNDLDIMRGINVGLPGGVVGRQAIFSIVENIIRNAAKHGLWGDRTVNKPSLVLSFNRYSKDDIINGLVVSDSDAADKKQLGLQSFLKKYYLHTQDIDDLFVFTLTDNMQLESEKGDKWDKLKALNRALIEPYIDEQGVMVNANKGIKEMRISAAWMRGLEERDVPAPINDDGTYIDTLCWDKKHAPVLMARPSKNPSTQLSNLQYIFCLLKPKAVAIITHPYNLEHTLDDGRTVGGMLSDNAIKILTKEEFIKLQDKSYDIIIFNDLESEHGYTKEDYDEVRRLSHNRIFRLSDKKVDKSLVLSVLNGSDDSIRRLIESLYQSLADYQEGDVIYIDDEKTDNKYNVEKKVEYPKTLVRISHDFRHVYPYMYRTHHETELKFSEFMTNYKSEIKSNRFVEGITGNNSTDRLVRNDVINSLWFYKHLHAMKTRVALFDERIFSKVYRREEKELEQESFESLAPKQMLQMMRYASKESTVFQPVEFRTLREQSALLDYVHSKDVFLIDADYSGVQFDMKGINVFTIIRRYNAENQADGLDIYGYFGYLSPNPSEKRNTYRSIIGRVGHISMKKGGDLSICLYNTIYQNAFDYISIHQGLLDKIYEHFGIKKYSEKKHKVTFRLYEEFIKDPSEYLTDTYKEKIGNTTVDKKGYFLPKLMVHSGRSKPSFVDMPQPQPFIQYSAIEHATLDCKYSLVELLDFARYEQE